MKAEQKSLTDQFITIDALIKQNQMSSALKELKKAEKRAYDVWTYLGVYKRYFELGENDLAEDVIVKAIKENPKNIELIAVYTNYLIKNNRLEDAEKYGNKLLNTEYASLYSEIVLRHSLNLNKSNNNYDFYKNKDFYDVFYNAYTTSKNPVWIRNCCIFDLIQGRYERINQIAPENFADVDDAFFWGLALYDSGNYYDSIKAVSKSQEYLQDLNYKGNSKTSAIEQVALLSDGYMCIADMEMAEKSRQELIFNIDEFDELDINNPLLPTIMTNSAIWAYNQGFDNECADLLFFIVNTWPDFVPGLVLYTDFAYNSNLQRKESPEIVALREAGLATMEMEQYDNRRKIPLSDAKYRVDEALKRTNDPYLSIIQLDLQFKMDSSLTEKEKNRELWNMLENSFEQEGKYKSLLVQYALHSLLLAEEYEDGWKLLYKYINDNSSFNDDENFWEQFTENIKLFDLGIAEFGALFAARNQLRPEALRLYEYCVYESNGILEDGLISQNVTSASAMNLADIYYSIGKEEKALDLYGKISGRESNKSIRSEIFYRIACIYSAGGDIKNALRSAEYACELYPDNVRASLLKDKLKLN